jgi:hypothetical protein
MQSLVIQCNDQPRTVPAIWQGDHLSVHRPIVKGGLSKAPRHWAITHNASGLAACLSFDGTKQSAVALARLWDQAFATITPNDASRWQYRDQWRRDLRIAQAGTGSPTGPVNRSPQQEKQEARTFAELQEATARALSYSPIPDDEALQQYPAEVDFIPEPGRLPYLGAVKRNASGSLWLYWIPQGRNYRDQYDSLVGWYEVPTLEEVESWTFSDTVPTPADDDLEPDHPDSWLRLLGLI